MDKKFLSLLSICQKAGKLISGEFSCEGAIRNEKVFLIIISEEASDNTKKKFINKAFYYKIPCYIYGNRDLISKSIGKQNRTTLAVTDVNFANKLENFIRGHL